MRLSKGFLVDNSQASLHSWCRPRATALAFVRPKMPDSPQISIFMQYFVC